MDFENNFKQFLKDTGCNEDEAMSKKEMMELQAAISNSKDTASLEEEKREYVRHAEEMQNAEIEKASTLKRQRSASKSPADIFEEEPEVQPSQKEFDITFQDMPECSIESLDIIYHKPAYALPIPFNPKYQKYSIQQRTKLLCDYHTKMGQLKTKLAKKSLHRAPFSKPILPSLNGKNSLSKSRQSQDGSFEEGGQIPSQEFYVSRAGRQVKRKIYTEEPEIEDNDFEISSIKRNKFTNSDTKITLDTPFVPEENHEEKSAPKPAKSRKDTPTKRALLSISTKKSRSENFFEKLLEDEVKKKQQQQEMVNFEKTLPTLEELDEEDKLLMDDFQETSVEKDDENFVRKRVVPSVPGRRPGIRAKKQPSVEDFDKIDVIQQTPPGSPKILKQYMNLNKSLTKSNSKTSKSKESRSEEVTLSKLEKTACPICNKQFLQSEIVNHASNCGIEEEEEIAEFEESIAELRCELCEKVFLANTNYEVHVKECIARKVTDL